MDYSIFIKDGYKCEEIKAIHRSFFGSNGVKIVGLDKDRKVIFSKRTSSENMFEEEARVREFFNL